MNEKKETEKPTESNGEKGGDELLPPPKEERGKDIIPVYETQQNDGSPNRRIEHVIQDWNNILRLEQPGIDMTGALFEFETEELEDDNDDDDDILVDYNDLPPNDIEEYMEEYMKDNNNSNNDDAEAREECAPDLFFEWDSDFQGDGDSDT